MNDKLNKALFMIIMIFFITLVTIRIIKSTPDTLIRQGKYFRLVDSWYGCRKVASLDE